MWFSFQSSSSIYLDIPVTGGHTAADVEVDAVAHVAGLNPH